MTFLIILHQKPTIQERLNSVKKLIALNLPRFYPQLHSEKKGRQFQNWQFF